MDLETLLRRLEHEKDTDRAGEEVAVLAPDGQCYDLLSLNWNVEHGHWSLIADPAE